MQGEPEGVFFFSKTRIVSHDYAQYSLHHDHRTHPSTRSAIAPLASAILANPRISIRSDAELPPNQAGFPGSIHALVQARNPPSPKKIIQSHAHQPRGDNARISALFDVDDYLRHLGHQCHLSKLPQHQFPLRVHPTIQIRRCAPGVENFYAHWSEYGPPGQ